MEDRKKDPSLTVEMNTAPSGVHGQVDIAHSFISEFENRSRNYPQWKELS